MPDRIITLLIVFGIVGAIMVVYLTIAALLNRSRARAAAAMKAPTRDRLQNITYSDGIRLFYEGEVSSLRYVKRQARRLAAVEILTEEVTPGTGGQEWNIRFAYRGYEFAIHTDPNGGSVFEVSNPSCSDEILITIAEHFDREEL